jgi:hypothetical protein
VHLCAVAGSDGIAKVWMTDVTLQGDGDGVRDCDACAVSNWARLYAEGMHLHLQPLSMIIQLTCLNIPTPLSSKRRRRLSCEEMNFLAAVEGSKKNQRGLCKPSS